MKFLSTIEETRRVLVVVLTGWLLLFTGPATAQTTAEPDTAASDTSAVPPDTAVREKTDLDKTLESLDQLTVYRQEIDELLDEAKGKKGEELELLRVQALNIIENVDDLSDKLGKNFAKLDTSLAIRDSIQVVSGDHLEYHARLYLNAMDIVARRLTSARRERDTVTPEELGEIEVRIKEDEERLDNLLALAVATARRLETIGLDASDVWDDLDQGMVERGEKLAGRLQLAVLERGRIREEIENAKKTGAALEDHNLRLQAAEQRIETMVASLKATSEHLNDRGVDAAKYQQMMIQVTGKVTEDILNPEVLKGLAENVFDNVVSGIKRNGPTWLVRLGILFLFILSFRLGGWIGWLLARLVFRPSKLLGDLVGRMIKPVTTVIGLIAGLWFLGVNPTALLASMGVLGIIVGLALQDTLGNLAAGLFILIYRPYDVDDSVTAGGVSGKVRAMGLANTTIITFDNRRLFIPNRKIWSEIIENRSAERVRRVEVTVRIAYGDDIEKSLKLIRAVLDEEPTVLKKPEPEVFVSRLDDESIELTVRPWANAEDWWDLTKAVPKLARVRLEESGFRVPNTTRVQIAASGDGEENDGSDPEGG